MEPHEWIEIGVSAAVGLLVFALLLRARRRAAAPAASGPVRVRLPLILPALGAAIAAGGVVMGIKGALVDGRDLAVPDMVGGVVFIVVGMVMVLIWVAWYAQIDDAALTRRSSFGRVRRMPLVDIRSMEQAPSGMLVIADGAGRVKIPVMWMRSIALPLVERLEKVDVSPTSAYDGVHRPGMMHRPGDEHTIDW